MYLYLTGNDVDIYLDAISLYKSRLTYETDPNTYDNDIVLEDLDIESTDDNLLDDYFNETIIDDLDDNESNEEVSKSNGRYKKIRRIYKTSWWVYALIIASGVIAVGGITILTIVIVRKKRKKIF